MVYFSKQFQNHPQGIMNENFTINPKVRVQILLESTFSVDFGSVA